MPAPTTVPGPARDPLLRNLLGRVLREERTAQRRTLADVARDARVSLPHLSEVERGRKEPSSEVLAAICTALDLTILEVLRRSAGLLAPLEVTVAPPNPALSGPAPFHPGRSTSTGVQLSLVA